MIHPGTNPSSAEEADPNGWRPIETAPKDGTQVLLYERGLAASFSGQWNDPWASGHFGWNLGPYLTFGDQSTGLNPTHWRPLPPPPAEAS